VTDYTVSVYDMGGSTVVADLPVSTLTVSKTLNAPGSVEFSLPMRHSDCTYANLQPLARRVKVFRGGGPIWGGDLWAASVDAYSQTVRFACEGYFKRLRYRRFAENLFYKNVDQLAIAWGLIEYTQAQSNLGITGSAGSSGVTRSRHYCAWESGTVADAIEDLATADDGFDFEIAPNLAWTVWHERRGTTSPSKTFTFGTGPTNETDIWSLRLDDDGSSVANQIAGRPDDDCLDVSDFVVVEDASSIADFGLMQDLIDLPNIDERDDRRAFLKEELRIRKVTRKQVELLSPSLPWDDGYEVGDVVGLTADMGYISYSSEPFRVISWSVEVAEGNETASVLLDSVTT